MRSGFFSGLRGRSGHDRTPLLSREPKEDVFDFQEDRNLRKLAHLVKANSNRGCGAVEKFFYLLVTATTIVALNTRSLMNLQVGETLVGSNCTNGTLMEGAEFLASSLNIVGNLSAACVKEGILFSEVLGDFFPLLAIILGVSSFLVCIVTRFNSVATHHDGLRADLKKKNRPLSNDEDNFFRIASQELPVVTAVYETEEIWIQYSPRILQGQAYSNFNYMKALLRGIYGERLHFTSGEIPREERQNKAVLHIAPFSEGNLEVASEYAVYRRLNLHTFVFYGIPIHSRYLQPWSRWDVLYFPARVLQKIATQYGPNTLMFSSIFSSMVKFTSLSPAINLARPDLSLLIRWPGFMISVGSAVIRTMINSKFKGVGAGIAWEIFFKRLIRGRWPKIFGGALTGTLLVSMVCFIYGWANALDFSVQGAKDFGQQLEYLIPPLRSLFSGELLLALAIIGDFYQDTQAVLGGFYYFVQGFRELYKNFYRWLYSEGREERSRMISEFTLTQKILFYSFNVLNFLDASAYGLSTFYFAQSAGNFPRLLNFLWYFSQFSKKGYFGFSLVLGIFNLIQNFVFLSDKAAESFKSFANFTPIRIENIDIDLDTEVVVANSEDSVLDFSDQDAGAFTSAAEMDTGPEDESDTEGRLGYQTSSLFRKPPAPSEEPRPVTRTMGCILC